MRKNSGLYLTIIILAAIIAGIFVYPKGWGVKWQPWRLGLDLVGGSHLVYHQKGNIPITVITPKNNKYVKPGYVKLIIKRLRLEG